MSSSIFLEILEERVLLSSQVVFLTTSPTGLDILAIVGKRVSRVFRDGSAVLAIQDVHLEVVDGSGNILGDVKITDEGGASGSPVRRRFDFRIADDLPGIPFPVGNTFSDNSEDIRQRVLNLLGVRQTVAAEANSVVDALESKNQEKSSDDSYPIERDERRHDDNDVGDHGPGGMPGNGFLNGTPVRSFEDPEANLFDPDTDLELALLPGPLADSIFLDGWRDSIPLSKAELVPATGHDLTVMATYLVGSVPTTSPAQPDAAPLDPASTDFIVGYSPARPEQTHCPIPTSTRAPIILEPVWSGERDTTRKGEDTRPTPTSIPTSEPPAEGTNPVRDEDTNASEEASSPSDQ
jgi:hypothetical protein